MTLFIDTLAELKSLVGKEVGVSHWADVGQGRIDTFALATDDHQWIHNDVERAKSGPFGGTIAHGYLTLALLIPLWTELLEVREVRTKVNYGLGRVRFPAPVPAGSRLRLRAGLADLKDIPGGAELTVDAVMEREGADKPVCVAAPIFRFLT